jgi:hypothetical protein
MAAAAALPHHGDLNLLRRCTCAARSPRVRKGLQNTGEERAKARRERNRDRKGGEGRGGRRGGGIGEEGTLSETTYGPDFAARS